MSTTATPTGTGAPAVEGAERNLECPKPGHPRNPSKRTTRSIALWELHESVLSDDSLAHVENLVGGEGGDCRVLHSGGVASLAPTPHSPLNTASS